MAACVPRPVLPEPKESKAARTEGRVHKGVFRNWAGLAFCGLLLGAWPALAQGPRGSGVKDAGDLADARPDNPTPRGTVQSAALDDRTDVTWPQLPKNFLHDQKDLWLFPIKLGQGKHLLPFSVVTVATAALIATDPQTTPHFRQADSFQDTSRALGGTTSGAVIAAVPATFYLVGLLRKNHYDQATSLFAGEAVADDVILMVVLKAITRRDRPSDRPVNGPYNDTFFSGRAGSFGKSSSFPSGHAMMSFSVATVFARRYRQHKWVPWVAYGAAALISFSRVTTGAHFPSEIVLGGALGFAIARYDVLHGH
jgi:membrane-associated phospholipid phosphatase